MSALEDEGLPEITSMVKGLRELYPDDLSGLLNSIGFVISKVNPELTAESIP